MYISYTIYKMSCIQWDNNKRHRRHCRLLVYFLLKKKKQLSRREIFLKKQPTHRITCLRDTNFIGNNLGGEELVRVGNVIF